jgi:cytochrome b561
MNPAPIAARAVRYSPIAIVLHWLMAAMIFAAFAMGLYMVDLSISPQKLKLYSWHKWIGVTVFLLAGLRLAWRLWRPPPAMPAMPAWQVASARWGHRLMYVLFFAIPISGWLFSSAKGFPTVYLGLVPLPDLVSKNEEMAALLKIAHQYSGYALGGMAVVHVAAAIKHHVADSNRFLARMWFGRG